MALQLYIGNSGSGKSYQLYNRVIKESQKHPNESFVVLVPEQFTMQTQKDFVTLHPKHGILNIDVLSFQRLAFRILDEVGGKRIPVLDEVGKTFVVRKVAEEKKEELVLLGGNLRKLGYVNEIKSFLTELTQYDISPSQLETIVQQSNSKQRIKSKLQDMKILYEAFRAYLKEKFITSEELLEVLYRMLDNSLRIKYSTIVIDGFMGFTPIQKKLLEKLMVLARNVWITVTYDVNLGTAKVLPDYHLFYRSSCMIADLNKMAEKTGTRRDRDILFPAKDNYRFQGKPALLALEQNLFRDKGVCYAEEQEAVTFHACKNPFEEIKFVAEEIRRLVMEQEYRYNDIAVVTGDMDIYSNYAGRIFRQYEIPCFIDHKKNVLANPMVEFLRALIEVAIQNFSYESVMRFLRTGLTKLQPEEIDSMENYILAFGIRGARKWSDKWIRHSKDMKPERLCKLNLWREQLIEDIFPFIQVFRKKSTTVLEKTTALHHVLERCQIQQKMKQYELSFLHKQELSLAKEYAQIYRIVIQIFEKLVELLGEEKADADQYAKLLEAGLTETKIGIIPPGIAQITIADIERSRLKDIKVMFFLGVNDGYVPKKVTDAGILSELEREQLKEQGVELAPGSKEQYYTQKFYLYLNLTKPSEKLYICYSKMDAQGNSLNPSYLIETIEHIFEKAVRIDEEARRHSIACVVSPKRGMEYLVERWNMEKDDGFFALYRWFENQEEYRGRLQHIKSAASSGKQPNGIDAAVARALYGDVLEGSVTRLERYAACAYAHFLQYGLSLQERETYGFEGLDFGNILHGVLEGYAQKVRDQELSWTQIEDQEQERLLDVCLEETITDYGNMVLYYTARDKYRIERMRRIARRTVWALTKQLKAGRFEPTAYEVYFKSIKELKTELGKDGSLNLRGRIDRTDIYEKDDDVFVKVVDYKTGHQEFKLLNLFYGLQLQLVVYLDAAMKIEQEKQPDKKVLPAGIVYYRIDDPLIEKEEGDTKESQENKLLRKLCVDGLISEKEEVLYAMDEQTLEAVKDLKTISSDVIPVSLKKDGMLSKKSKTATDEEFKLMTDYAGQKIRQMGKEILDGNILLNPYQEGTHAACDYCSYKGICGFDIKKKEHRYRKLDKLTEDEIFRQIEEACKEEGE